MEGAPLSKEQVDALGDLPSKEELMARIARGINANTTKIATGIKEVPTSLARALREVSEKDNEEAA